MSEIIIKKKDNGKVIKVTHDDVIVICLEENISTGYSWQAGDIDRAIIELLEKSYTQPNEDRKVGGSGTRTFRLKAKLPGNVKIHLRLRRPWEADDKAIENFELNLTVVNPE